MKTKRNQITGLAIAITTALAAANASRAATVTVAPSLSPSFWLSFDPRFNSWKFNDSAALASVRLENGGATMTEWEAIDTRWEAWKEWLPLWQGLAGGRTPQPTVSGMLADVTAIHYDSDYIYVTGNGLASYPMGPWYTGLDKDHDGVVDPFEFRPLDRATANKYAGTLPIAKIPRSPKDAAPQVFPTGLGAIGVWVNGTSVYGTMAGFHYDDSAQENVAAGTGIWNVDAVVAESVTFDPPNFHQDWPGTTANPYPILDPVPTWGQHHAHINPLGIRCQLNDHVKAVTDNDTGEFDHYNQLPALGQHSPILGWAFDGYPIYGPYGYSDLWNPSKGVSRMRSGYVLRNGDLGTRNLYSKGRDRLPNWAAIAQDRSPTLASDEKGPSPGTAWWNPSPDFPLGSFIEDWDYRGDLTGGGTWGKDWDLDRYNGRHCVTPEVKDGTYAYFVSLDGNLNPQFPYIIGPIFKGKPTGGEVASVPGPPFGARYK